MSMEPASRWTAAHYGVKEGCRAGTLAVSVVVHMMPLLGMNIEFALHVDRRLVNFSSKLFLSSLTYRSYVELRGKMPSDEDVEVSWHLYNVGCSCGVVFAVVHMCKNGREKPRLLDVLRSGWAVRGYHCRRQRLGCQARLPGPVLESTVGMGVLRNRSEEEKIISP